MQDGDCESIRVQVKKINWIELGAIIDGKDKQLLVC